MKPLILMLAMATAALAKPTLWIIGDSTVRNNTRNQKGWGDPLSAHFDPDKIAVSNKAIGGRSSRTFLTEGRWEEIMKGIKAGDFVIMQFGHNDGGQLFKGDRPRASIKGNGDETESGIVEATGKEETVHSYGWYLRKYAADTLAKGATPIICSPIPRNMRNAEGKTGRDGEKGYTLWAKQAAEKAGAHFIDLNALLADAYDKLGKDATDALFDKPDHTHTSPKGAEFNAGIVAEAIRALPAPGLAGYMR